VVALSSQPGRISSVDAEGARALAERIAAGRPTEGVVNEPLLPATTASTSLEIVYVKPVGTMRRDVRIYVRGRDGRLERRDS
jgi:hypothetical protein